MSRAPSDTRWKVWGLGFAVAALCVALVALLNHNVNSENGNRSSERSSINSGSATAEIEGVEPSGRTLDSGSHFGLTTDSSSRAEVASGPAGYRSLLNRLIASGLMSEFGTEFTSLLGGEELLLAVPCDLTTFLSRLDSCTTPEEVKALLAPFADAIRLAEKNKDPNLLQIQRQLGVALLFAAEQVAESSTLSPEQQLDTLVKLGGALVVAGNQQLLLALNDVALDFTAVPDSQRNRKNVDLILRGRLEVAARMQDLQLLDSAAERWVLTSRDQKDSSVASRMRIYAQRLATFPPGQLTSQGGASWPGLAQSSTGAIVGMGTSWLRPPKGASRAGYIAARDALLVQLDEIIRERGARGEKPEEVKKLVEYRKKVASARMR